MSWEYFLHFVSFLVLTALLVGCSKPEAPPPAPPEVTVMQIEATDSPVTFEFVGITASSQQVEVRARVDGFLDDRLYTEGSIVEKGDVMFRMDAKPYQAQLDAPLGKKLTLQAHRIRIPVSLATTTRPFSSRSRICVSLARTNDSTAPRPA